MAKLIFEIAMSLDGFVAGPDQTLDEPLGKGGDQLHKWAFAAKSFRENHGLSGGEANVDSEVIDEHLRNTGATVMGRRMFSGGEGPWEDDPNQMLGGATILPSTTRCSSSPTTPASR